MKKTWTTPELTVYGSVEELTQKQLGLGDAVLFDSRSDDDDDEGMRSL
jgi:hypothetical protein